MSKILPVAVVLAALIIAGSLVFVALGSRYEYVVGGGLFRTDRLTGEVAVCRVTMTGRAESRYRAVECAASHDPFVVSND